MSTVPEEEPATETLPSAKPPFLRRVQIRGYKSIAFCDVTLEPLTILVGRNASGKSNFLDALAFLRDIVAFGLNEAVKRHGTASSILHRSASPPRVEILLEMELTAPPPSGLANGDARSHDYAITYQISIPFQESNFGPLTERITARQLNGKLSWDLHTTLQRIEEDQPSSGLLPTSLPVPIGSSALNLLAYPPFPQIANAMRSIGVYNFQPEAIRQLQKPESKPMLDRDGKNLASVIKSIQHEDKWLGNRIRAFLSAIVNDVEDFEVVRYGNYETVKFRVRTADENTFQEFDAASMSDGTLRVLAALVAVAQVQVPSDNTVIGIEEPETSLHPAAVRALVGALDEATLRTQIVLTTHSAEMLDNPTIRPENIRVVQLINGQTVIGPLDEASVEIVARKLNMLGDLQRENQLGIDFEDQDRQRQLAQAQKESR